MPSKTKKSQKKSRKQSFSKQEVDIAVREIKKNNPKLNKSITTEKKENFKKKITLDFRDTMIKYKEEGKFEEFMKDVCKINEEQLREFCKKLKITVLQTDNYKSICNKIIFRRPDLFSKNKLYDWRKTIGTIGALASLSLWIYLNPTKNSTKSCISTFKWNDLNPFTYLNPFTWSLPTMSSLGKQIPMLFALHLWNMRSEPEQKKIALQYLKENADFSKRIRSISRSRKKSPP